MVMFPVFTIEGGRKSLNH